MTHSCVQGRSEHHDLSREGVKQPPKRPRGNNSRPKIGHLLQHCDKILAGVTASWRRSRNPLSIEKLCVVVRLIRNGQSTEPSPDPWETGLVLFFGKEQTFFLLDRRNFVYALPCRESPKQMHTSSSSERITTATSLRNRPLCSLASTRRRQECIDRDW